MARSQSYTQYLAVVLLLSLYSIKQVSAARCYACNSDINPECISAAAQPKFAVECSPYNTYASTNSSILSAIKTHDNTVKPEGRRIVEYDCASARGISTKDGRPMVIRGCAVKRVTCDTYKIVYAVGDGRGNGFQVEACNRCSAAYCNAY